uniref:Uncharacterized protein n=1 Tax=Meteorus pulchricornis TaxID=51522 RepID=H7CHK6_9HYME|nr:hypothetical protein [Meteorus pulchricornis]
MLAYYFFPIFVVGPLIMTTKVMGVAPTETPADGVARAIDNLPNPFNAEKIKDALNFLLDRIDNDRKNLTQIAEDINQGSEKSEAVKKITDDLLKELGEAAQKSGYAEAQAKSASILIAKAEELAAYAAAAAKTAQFEAEESNRRNSGVATSPYAYLYTFICVYAYLYI